MLFLLILTFVKPLFSENLNTGMKSTRQRPLKNKTKQNKHVASFHEFRQLSLPSNVGCILEWDLLHCACFFNLPLYLKVKKKKNPLPFLSRKLVIVGSGQTLPRRIWINVLHDSLLNLQWKFVSCGPLKPWFKSKFTWSILYQFDTVHDGPGLP